MSPPARKAPPRRGLFVDRACCGGPWPSQSCVIEITSLSGLASFGQIVGPRLGLSLQLPTLRPTLESLLFPVWLRFVISHRSRLCGRHAATPPESPAPAPPLAYAHFAMTRFREAYSSAALSARRAENVRIPFDCKPIANSWLRASRSQLRDFVGWMCPLAPCTMTGVHGLAVTGS